MRKVLIVEDEVSLRDAYIMILSTQPYDVYNATNGKDALLLCGQNNFDLILLDLMMPELSGLEFLEQFKDRKPAKTKIIILSNISTGKDLEQCLRLGAHKCVVKASLGPSQLLDMVRYELKT